MINNSHHSSSILYFQFLVSEFWNLNSGFWLSDSAHHISWFWILDAVPFVLIWMNSRFYICQFWILNSTFWIIHSVLWILDCGFWMAQFFTYDFWILIAGFWTYHFWILDSAIYLFFCILLHSFLFFCILLYVNV